MKSRGHDRFALGICATVAVLSGCGGLQPPPIGAPGATQQSAEIAASPSYRILYSFRGGSDGKFPFASLTNVNGTLYGTTARGGANRHGTLFSVTTTGAEKVLHSFGGDSDGSNPNAGLIEVKGTLYGTTAYGGAYGGGTVFGFTTTGTEKVLYSFTCCGYDGTTPEASLINVKGTFYGTTIYAGDESGSAGTVFSVTMAGMEKVLHDFKGLSDGANPEASLINLNGTLYGTTVEGGAHGGDGIIFSITKTGTEKVLHGFGRGSDGANPEASLIKVNGTLYGTTQSGGLNGNGTVFSVTTTGKERVLYSFRGSSDGIHPGASLINVNGTLYGTTQSGGSSGYGTVFGVTTTGTEKVLHSFGGGSDGAAPYANLIDVNGELYGTTANGGDGGCKHQGGCGTIFALTPPAANRGGARAAAGVRVTSLEPTRRWQHRRFQRLRGFRLKRSSFFEN